MKREVEREDFEVNQDGAVGKKEVGLTQSSTINDQPSQERGASLVEYALLVALIAVIGVGGIRVVGENAKAKLHYAGEVIGAGAVVECNPAHPNFPDC